MKRLYRSTFDQVKLSEETAARMRERLAAASSPKEVLPMKKHLWRTIPVAAVLIAALVCTASAYGKELWNYLQLLTGHTFSASYDDETGLDIRVEDEQLTCVQVEDDRIYCTLSGQREDITNQCSKTDYFAYEEMDEEGNRQVLLVGGTPEHWGYLDVTWLSEGGAVCNCSIQQWDPWIDRACADYAIDRNRIQLSIGAEGYWVVFQTDEEGQIIFSTTKQNELTTHDERLIIPTAEEIIANGYPVNERGETYGPNVIGMDLPDLVLAENSERVLGYIRLSDEPQPQTIEEALAISGQQYTFTLYLQDGETIIGTY